MKIQISFEFLRKIRSENTNQFLNFKKIRSKNIDQFLSLKKIRYVFNENTYQFGHLKNQI